MSEEYRNVTSMELIYGYIPNDYFNIIKCNRDKGYIGNNTFYIKFNDGILRNYEIFEGYYSIDYLIDTLNGEYGDLLDNSHMRFIYNDFNQRVLMYSVSEFVYNINYDINCNDLNSIDRILGFNTTEYQSNFINLNFNNITMNYIIDSESSEMYRYKKSFMVKNFTYNYNDTTYSNPKNFIKKDIYVNVSYNDGSSTTTTIAQIYYVNECTIILSFCDNAPDELNTNLLVNINYYFTMGDNAVNLENYLILQIPEFHTIDSLNHSSERSFMVFPPFASNNFRKGNAPVTDGNIKYFSPPKDRIQSMVINFKQSNGNIVNFNGKDHFLMFKVTGLNQPSKYNEYIPKNN